MRRLLAFLIILIMLMSTACSKPEDNESNISTDKNTKTEQSTDNLDTQKEQEQSSEQQKETAEQNKQTDTTVTDNILEPYTNSRSFDFDLSKPEDRAYSDFIKKLNDIHGYAVKDINDDGSSELIITKPEVAITVYSYNGKVFEAGNYEFYTATRRLLYSEKYAGIIAFTAGGGSNLYRYVTIKNGKLVLEDIWKDYYAYDGENVATKEEIFTNDEMLMTESEFVYNNSQDIRFIDVEE